MQLCNTKNNHYVPQFYLKSFIGIEGYIYYYDKVTKTLRQTTNSQTLAFKTNLYTVTQKIKRIEIQVFSKLFDLTLNSPLEKMFLFY